MNILIISIITFSLYAVNTVNAFGYMTKTQWNTVNNALQNNIGYQKKLKLVKDILYDKHHLWMNKYTSEFIKKNNFLITNQQKKELREYASIGILKAIQRYNGTGNFYRYSSIYMMCELCKGISTILPYKLDSNDYKQDTLIEMNNVVRKSTHITNFHPDSLYELNAYEMKIFYMRHHHITYQVKRSYDELGEIFCCSSRTICNDLYKIYNKLSDLNK